MYHRKGKVFPIIKHHHFDAKIASRILIQTKLHLLTDFQKNITDLKQ